MILFLGDLQETFLEALKIFLGGRRLIFFNYFSKFAPNSFCNLQLTSTWIFFETVYKRPHFETSQPAVLKNCIAYILFLLFLLPRRYFAVPHKVQEITSLPHRDSRTHIYFNRVVVTNECEGKQDISNEKPRLRNHKT